MCCRVECKSCGKYTWGGCGKHLTTLYASIDDGMHCTCRSWPGLLTSSQRTTKPTTTHSNTPSQGNGTSQN